VVEYLLKKCKALNSIPSTEKKAGRAERKEGREGRREAGRKGGRKEGRREKLKQRVLGYG
jgi:general stress protein YciG